MCHNNTLLVGKRVTLEEKQDTLELVVLLWILFCGKEQALRILFTKGKVGWPNLLCHNNTLLVGRVVTLEKKQDTLELVVLLWILSFVETCKDCD